MAQEIDTYDYSENPHIDAFKRLVRTPQEQHPWITLQEQRVKDILDDIPYLELPTNLDTRLIPDPSDLGLVLTPYDNLEKVRVRIPPEAHMEGWKILHDYNLRLVNHPARIHAMMALENRGFRPPQKLSPGVIDYEEAQGHIMQLADLAHAIDLTQGMVDRDNLEYLAISIKTLREAGEERVNSDPELQKLQRDVEKFVSQIEDEEQAHRTELLATGPFTLIDGMAFSYIGVGAMPDITGSVLFGNTAARSFTRFGIPEIGPFSDHRRQAALAKSIQDSLTVDDPLLNDYDLEIKRYIVNHWKACAYGVVEVNPDKALRRAEHLAKAGIVSFRPYGHTRGGDVIKTVRALRREYPGAIIDASQITSEYVALACEYEGANLVTIGVGSGGRCTTAWLSELNPTNAHLGWRLRGKLGIPYIGEGGGVDHPIIAALVGFSGVNGSGSIGGGTFEAPGGIYFLTRDDKIFFKPYGGEASRRYKHLSKRTFGTGITYVEEGEESEKIMQPLRESMTQNMIGHWTRVGLGAVVLGVDAGPFIIEALQSIVPSPLYGKSHNGDLAQKTH